MKCNVCLGKMDWVGGIQDEDNPNETQIIIYECSFCGNQKEDIIN